MKKVGILSMQRICNYGSFLQAYGLKKLIEELGCHAEFVDYHPGSCLVNNGEKKGFLRKLEKASEAFGYNAPFREKIRYIRYKKNYAENYYPMLGIADHMNYSPELDMLVIGSDEVFNCVQSNTNVGFSPELFGVGNHARRLISYAASFGNTSLQKLQKYQVRDEVAAYLKEFDALSVRDENSCIITKALTGNEPFCHFDPVLVYDFMGKCSQIPLSVGESDYLLLYGYAGRFSREECDCIRRYADSRGLKIYCIGGVQGCCDKFIDCDPFTVIAYFKNADCIVTDTFHGSILSVITHSQFISVVRNSSCGNSEKLADLMNRLELSGRIADNMNDIDKLMAGMIDYDAADRIIERERRRSRDYLKEQIDCAV